MYHQIRAKAATKMLYSIVVNLNKSYSRHLIRKGAGNRSVSLKNDGTNHFGVVHIYCAKVYIYINQPKFRHPSPLQVTTAIYFEIFITRIILHDFELLGEFVGRGQKCF